MEGEGAEGRFSQIKNKREICMKSSHLSEGGGVVLKISINVRNNHYNKLFIKLICTNQTKQTIGQI